MDSETYRKLLKRFQFLKTKYGIHEDAEELLNNAWIKWESNPSQTLEQSCIDFIRVNYGDTRHGRNIEKSLARHGHYDGISERRDLGEDAPTGQGIREYSRYLKRDQWIVCCLLFEYGFTQKEVGYVLRVSNSRISQVLSQAKEQIAKEQIAKEQIAKEQNKNELKKINEIIRMLKSVKVDHKISGPFFEIVDNGPTVFKSEKLNDIVLDHVKKTFSKYGLNKSVTSKKLGVSIRTLTNWGLNKDAYLSGKINSKKMLSFGMAKKEQGEVESISAQEAVEKIGQGEREEGVEGVLRQKEERESELGQRPIGQMEETKSDKVEGFDEEGFW